MHVRESGSQSRPYRGADFPRAAHSTAPRNQLSPLDLLACVALRTSGPLASERARPSEHESTKAQLDFMLDMVTRAGAAGVAREDLMTLMDVCAPGIDRQVVELQKRGIPISCEGGVMRLNRAPQALRSRRASMGSAAALPPLALQDGAYAAGKLWLHLDSTGNSQVVTGAGLPRRLARHPAEILALLISRPGQPWSTRDLSVALSISPCRVEEALQTLSEVGVEVRYDAATGHCLAPPAHRDARAVSR